MALLQIPGQMAPLTKAVSINLKWHLSATTLAALAGSHPVTVFDLWIEWSRAV